MYCRVDPEQLDVAKFDRLVAEARSASLVDQSIGRDRLVRVSMLGHGSQPQARCSLRFERNGSYDVELSVCTEAETLSPSRELCAMRPD
jgi:hypothetical protein